MNKLEIVPSQVKQLYGEGKTIRQIASILNISFGTVRNIMIRNSIDRRHRRSAPAKDILQRLYSEKTLSANEIAEQLNYPAITIHQALKRYGIPRRTKSEATRLAISKQRFDLRFQLKQPDFSKLKEISYIVGVLKGDGSVGYFQRSRNYRIYLAVLSKAFAIEFYQALKEIGLNPHYYEFVRKIYKGGKRFEVTASSKIFYEWYKCLSYEDLLKLDYFPFLRGFIQSEGSYDKKRSCLDIATTDKKLMEIVLEMITRMGIKGYFRSKKYNWGKGAIYIVRVRDKELCEIKKEYYENTRCITKGLD